MMWADKVIVCYSRIVMRDRDFSQGQKGVHPMWGE